MKGRGAGWALLCPARSTCGMMGAGESDRLLYAFLTRAPLLRGFFWRKLRNNFGRLNLTKKYAQN
jgi:hypothetical protein